MNNCLLCPSYNDTVSYLYIGRKFKKASSLASLSPSQHSINLPHPRTHGDMNAINKDGSLNISMLERQVREDMAIHSKSRAEDEMKKKALHSSKDYDEFNNFVSVSQLNPVSNRDVSSLFNGSTGLQQTTFRNRTVHGASKVQSCGIGCLDGYIDERKENQKDTQMTAKMESKGSSSSAKSSRDAHNFLAHWKQQCSSSASDALSFLVQIKETPETICRTYFATDIDSDVVGDIVSALHHLMSQAQGKNDHIDNDESFATLIADLDEATMFISSWLKAMMACGRFDLARSFLTSTQESQLNEIVEFVKEAMKPQVEQYRSMRITEDEKKELANPNCDKEWVQEHRARERRLLEAGVTKEQLDSLSEYYRSKYESDDQFYDSLVLTRSEFKSDQQ